METKKVKWNGKLEKIFPNRRARDIPWKNKERNTDTSLSDTEFKRGVIKHTNWIKKIIDINTDHCNKELEILKFDWSKRNNFWDKDELEAMNSWLNDTEKWINDLQDRIMEMNLIRTANRKEIFKNEGK